MYLTHTHKHQSDTITNRYACNTHRAGAVVIDEVSCAIAKTTFLLRVPSTPRPVNKLAKVDGMLAPREAVDCCKPAKQTHTHECLSQRRGEDKKYTHHTSRSSKRPSARHGGDLACALRPPHQR